MPEQIQSMLILADGSTSWNVLFYLEQLVEKRQEKKKDKFLSVRFSSLGVTYPPRISKWNCT